MLRWSRNRSIRFRALRATVRSGFGFDGGTMDDELRSWLSSNLMHFGCMSWIMLVDWPGCLFDDSKNQSGLVDFSRLEISLAALHSGFPLPDTVIESSASRHRIALCSIGCVVGAAVVAEVVGPCLSRRWIPQVASDRAVVIWHSGWRLGYIPAAAAISELEWQCLFAVFPLLLGCTVRVFLHVGVVDAVSLVLLFAAAGLGPGLAVSANLPAEPVHSAGGVAFRACACSAPILNLNPMLILSFEELVGCASLFVADGGSTVLACGCRLLCSCKGMQKAGRPCC
ncbi:hypothetical protein Nepgr_030108 [Nepenthes gracilis]|uniref:Uncharacterized protein n=1 Tax=Nepenthes gracilis TaxID=150966 RepID=A0AAD3TDY6_NEPGR|nr:hypothetical protein Nepgr_030108 [Nepenthes gracilis]